MVENFPFCRHRKSDTTYSLSQSSLQTIQPNHTSFNPTPFPRFPFHINYVANQHRQKWKHLVTFSGIYEEVWSFLLLTYYLQLIIPGTVQRFSIFRRKAWRKSTASNFEKGRKSTDQSLIYNFKGLEEIHYKQF